MSIWVKICANTSLADARMAVDSGANAVGFVFAPSPRRVTAEQVARIAPQLPGSVEKIGVFVDGSLDEIVSTARLCGLTGVQLHSMAGPQLPARLREELGPDLRILRVVHFGADVAEHALAFAADPNVNAVLVDSRTAAAVGGTGITFDWHEARRSVFSDASKIKLVAAGGLNPDNVAEAIVTLRPWGVDVASGVEAAPGKKDPSRVSAFIASARASSYQLL